MTRFIIIILLFSFVGYTSTNPLGGESPFKWVVYSLIIALPVSILSLKKTFIRYSHNFGGWVIVFSLLFCAQLIIAHENFINDFILWMSFICLSVCLVGISLSKTTYLSLLVLLIVDIVLGIDGHAIASSYASGWAGMFQNPNTNSIFLLSVLISTFFGCKDKKLRIMVATIILLGIIATRSRNAALSYMIFIGGILFQYKLEKFQMWFPFILVGILIFAGYYMAVIEMTSDQSAVELFGKSKGSAGRSLQIVYIISNYKLSLFGYGRIVNSLVEDNTGYPVHNMYIASIYVLGIVISIAYLWFVYWLFRSSYSYKFKIGLIAVHFYYFFEPGYFFCVQMSYFLPMFALCVNYWPDSKFNHVNRSHTSNNRIIHKFISNL